MFASSVADSYSTLLLYQLALAAVAAARSRGFSLGASRSGCWRSRVSARVDDLANGARAAARRPQLAARNLPFAEVG
jgi:hypothetical protein